jgi:hypothetical protein
VVRQFEIEKRNYALELVDSYLSLSQLIEISKEFFNSHSLHHNHSLQSFLHIVWIIGNVYSWLRKPAFGYIDILCRT